MPTKVVRFALSLGESRPHLAGRHTGITPRLIRGDPIGSRSHRRHPGRRIQRSRPQRDRRRAALGLPQARDLVAASWRRRIAVLSPGRRLQRRGGPGGLPGPRCCAVLPPLCHFLAGGVLTLQSEPEPHHTEDRLCTLRASADDAQAGARAPPVLAPLVRSVRAAALRRRWGGCIGKLEMIWTDSERADSGQF